MGFIEEKSETMHITNKIEWPPKNDNPRTIQRYLQGEPISITIDDDTLPMEGMIIIMDDAETEAQKIQRLEHELDALLEDDAPYGKERFADVSVEMENLIKSEKGSRRVLLTHRFGGFGAHAASWSKVKKKYGNIKDCAMGDPEANVEEKMWMSWMG